jgi:hypothetical protein
MGKEEEESNTDTLGPVYNDTQCIINKDTYFQWGGIYQMFHYKPNLPNPSRR